ncbi:MAG: bile acid:sodium symporter family protein [Tunicatimonas sp.]
MEILDTVTLRFDQQSLRLMNACLGLVMFGVALELTPADFRRLASEPRGVLTGLAAQLVLLPAATYGLVSVLPITTSVALGMLLVSACPGGNLSNLLTVMARGNGALSVSLTALSTLLAVVAVPLNFSFWANTYLRAQDAVPPLTLPLGSLVGTLAVVVVLPLALGMATNRYLPRLTRRVRRPVRIVSLVIFGAFIIGALAANWSVFLEYVHWLVLIVLGHNAIAYALGYGLSVSVGLAPADRRAITLETGIQNSGLALVLIFTFLDGLGGMALLAGWWGIWDMISGLALAGVLGKR